MNFLPCILFVLSLQLAFAADPGDYVVLEEGMEWIMDVKLTAPDGRVVEEKHTRKVAAKEEKDGKTYFRVVQWTNDGKPLGATMMRKTETGIFAFFDHFRKDDPWSLYGPKPTEHPWLLIPLVAGKTWSESILGETIKREVVGFESVQIKGVTYKEAVKIRGTPEKGDYTEEIWIAPKVGWVQTSISFKSGSKALLTLREFKPAKK